MKDLNIFIVYTPLHILIAEKIVEKENLDKTILFSPRRKTDKLDFYFRKSIKFDYKVSGINNLIKLLFKFNKYKVNIFVGNLKKTYSRLIIFLLHNRLNYLFTFDDGSGNIAGKGYFYNKNENIISWIFFTLLNRKFLYKNIINLINKHYTIYKNLPNVFEEKNLKYLNLFPKIDKFKNIKKDKIIILLTNSFAEEKEMSLKDEIKLYDKIIFTFNVTHIIKHPLEKFNKVDEKRVTIIKSPFIAEEIIYSLCKEYKNVKVIGIYSTVLFNLTSLNIELINIDVPLPKPTDGLKEILIKLKIKNITL
jgi:beta-galactosamide-alpha-2,3-sialyltransferase